MQVQRHERYEARTPDLNFPISQIDVAAASQLLTLNRKIIRLLGLWPFSLNDRIFIFVASFLTLQCCLEYLKLIQYFDNLKLIFGNLTETWTHTMALFKISVCRIKSKQLRQLLLDIEEDYAIKKYETLEEWQSLIKYNQLAQKLIKADTGNSSTAYNLPYQTRLFFEVTEQHTYILIYVLQSLVVPIIGLGFCTMDFFIITLILHVCGQLAILKLRIKNIVVHPRGSSYAIGQIVKRHVHLIRLTNAIDDMFNILLMWEIIGVSVVFCLVGYNVLMNSQDGFKINFLIYFVFILGAFLNLYSNYFVGDRLISESTGLCYAFYDCEWYNIPPQHARNLLICMSRAQIPMVLTAGKFYVLSLENFTDIMKTAMAIVSVLRKTSMKN